MVPDVLPLVPVCTEYFTHKVIDSEEGCEVEDFCTQNKLKPTAFNIFLTVEHLPERMKDHSPRDIIVMDRVSNSCMHSHNTHNRFIFCYQSEI